MDTSQVVRELARPFPSNYVKEVQGADYVPHHIVNQRAIHIFGEPPKVEILREIYDGEKLTGVVMRMTIFGLWSEEAGASDNPQSKTNGDRLKDACSDAYKRCAMRLGLGLHLWAQKDYFLFDALTKNGEGHSQTGEGGSHPDPTPAERDAPSPVLRAKRMHLKQLAESRKFDIEANAGMAIADMDLDELERSISLVQQMQEAL